MPAGRDARPYPGMRPGSPPGAIPGGDNDIQLPGPGAQVRPVPYLQALLRGRGPLRLPEDSRAGQHQPGLPFALMPLHVYPGRALQLAALFFQAAAGLGSDGPRLDQQGPAAAHSHEAGPVSCGLARRPAQQRRGDQLDFRVTAQDLRDEHLERDPCRVDPDSPVRAIAVGVHGIFTTAVVRLLQAVSPFPGGCEVTRPYGYGQEWRQCPQAWPGGRLAQFRHSPRIHFLWTPAAD